MSFYDKEHQNKDGSKGANVVVKMPFTFIVLDELGVVKGWHDASDSGITSNEVRDTRSEVMVVRAFKGGVLASGLYAGIRDKVSACGGHYTSSVYIAYRDGAEMKLGNIQFKGDALKHWMEFRKQNAKAIWEKAVSITGSKEGKKGSIVFHSPVFALKDCSEEANNAAGELQKTLAAFLVEYFAKTKSVQSASQQPADNITPMPAAGATHPPADDSWDAQPSAPRDEPALADQTDVPF